MYVLRAFCAFSFLVIIFHSRSLSHSLTLYLSVSFFCITFVIRLCCVDSFSIIFCVSNKQLQLTPRPFSLFPYPTFNPNKPTIFVSLLRTRFPRVLCAFLTAPVTQSVISLLQHAICHMQRQNLQLIQVFFSIFVISFVHFAVMSVEACFTSPIND